MIAHVHVTLEESIAKRKNSSVLPVLVHVAQARNFHHRHSMIAVTDGDGIPKVVSRNFFPLCSVQQVESTNKVSMIKMQEFVTGYCSNFARGKYATCIPTFVHLKNVSRSIILFNAVFKYIGMYM